MKLQNMVKFPLTGLDMTPHVVKRSQSSWSLPSHWSPWRRPYGLGRDPEDYIYDLYAVCNHHGTMQGGHYTGLQCERLRVCADASFRLFACSFWTSLSFPVCLLPALRAASSSRSLSKIKYMNLLSSEFIHPVVSRPDGRLFARDSWGATLVYPACLPIIAMWCFWGSSISLT